MRLQQLIENDELAPFVKMNRACDDGSTEVHVDIAGADLQGKRFTEMGARKINSFIFQDQEFGEAHFLPGIYPPYDSWLLIAFYDKTVLNNIQAFMMNSGQHRQLGERGITKLALDYGYSQFGMMYNAMPSELHKFEELNQVSLHSYDIDYDIDHITGQ